MSDRCSVRQGVYQCRYAEGHKCEHETDSKAPSRLGPYGTEIESSAYLHGALEFSTSGSLDFIGRKLGVERADREADFAYRNRLWRTYVGRVRKAQGYTGPRSAPEASS